MFIMEPYSLFCMSNIKPDVQFVKLIEDDVKEELISWFEPIWYKLLVSLCTNFKEKSYFRLKPFMSNTTLHQRLLVLNMIALLLSLKFLKTVSLLGFLLYDEDFKISQNYREQFLKLILWLVLLLKMILLYYKWSAFVLR